MYERGDLRTGRPGLLERQLRPEAYGRVRGGYISRRRPPAQRKRSPRVGGVSPPADRAGLVLEGATGGGVRRSSSPDRFGRRVECRPGRSRRPDAHQHSQWPRTVAAAGPGPRRGRLHGHHPASHPVPGLRRVGLDPGPTFALHLDCGSWRASCTGCGLELAKGRHQDRVEHKAAHRSCPVCVEVA